MIWSKAVVNAEKRTITLYGPKYQGKWTQVQAGQTEFAGISKAGITRWAVCRQGAKAGRTGQHGLQVEKAFLKKIRHREGIQGLTAEEEAQRRRNRGQNRDAPDEEPMAEADVLAEFDD